MTTATETYLDKEWNYHNPSPENLWQVSCRQNKKVTLAVQKVKITESTINTRHSGFSCNKEDGYTTTTPVKRLDVTFLNFNRVEEAEQQQTDLIPKVFLFAAYSDFDCRNSEKGYVYQFIVENQSKLDFLFTKHGERSKTIEGWIDFKNMKVIYLSPVLGEPEDVKTFRVVFSDNPMDDIANYIL